MNQKATKLKRIAIHLPQFHPVKENDEWWGKGFTEWTNVVKARPRFKGHYQPQLPADLGFYDLRLEEARLAQESLAKENNIYGFCYYHYWFNGKRILQEPINRKLKNPKEDLPFMLCWANENWTRAWDGRNHDILMKQDYDFDDDLAHIKFLIEIFKDPRYIRVNDKPVFVIYKPDLFPDMNKTLNIFREEAAKQKIELHLIWFERYTGWTSKDLISTNFDASVEFQPLSKSYHTFKKLKKNQKDSWFAKKYKLYEYYINKKIIGLPYINPKSNNIISYKDFVDHDLERGISRNTYPGVCPGWDNSSRRGKKGATIFINNTPEDFKKWIDGKEDQFKPEPEMGDFLFINAWNEWAEGNHLEPCKKWGNSFLKVLK